MTEKVDAEMSSKENKHVYIVPTTKIEIEEKIGPDQQPRFLEDEGMYIGIKPVIPKGKNHNKMEQRILKEQSIQGKYIFYFILICSSLYLTPWF